LVPRPTYPLYTAILSKIGARAVYYRTDPSKGWQPDPKEIAGLITPRTKAFVVNDPNNPTGAAYPPDVRRALVAVADEHNFPLIADEVYADLAFDGPMPAIASHDPDAPVITFSSLSKAYLAPGWRSGWMGVGRTARLDSLLAGVKKLADGRLCTTAPMEYAVAAALNGDRSHQAQFRAELRARAALTTERLNAIEGLSVVAPAAAFYAMPKVALPPGVTDEEYVLGLLRATGILCVYGSGFGTSPGDGFFRVVFLAPLDELSEIYDTLAEFTQQFLGARATTR
jgi:alanine-synthesizing transaminase